MNPFLSSKFRFYSFISMVLLVFVHGYNLQMRYLQPWTPVYEPLTFNTFTQYFLANGLFRFRIPMLFAISGYLFALGDHQPYSARIKKRARTLLLPYFLWSIIGLLIALAFTAWPVTKEVVYNTHLQPSPKPFTQYTAGDWIAAILLPTSFQLWFIRCLFFYNLLYPLLAKGLTRHPAVWFTIFTALWLSMFSVMILEGEGLLFFSLGIFLCKKQKDIEHTPKWLKLPVWSLLFVGVCIIKTVLAFHTKGHEAYIFYVMLLLHKMTIFSGLAVVWFGCDGVVRFFMSRKWFTWFSAFSFIIYALHVPLITYLIDPAFSVLKNVAGYRFITFIFLPLIIIAFCIGAGWILRRTVPAFYGLLTGGRGFAKKEIALKEPVRNIEAGAAIV